MILSYRFPCESLDTFVSHFVNKFILRCQCASVLLFLCNLISHGSKPQDSLVWWVAHILRWSCATDFDRLGETELNDLTNTNHHSTRPLPTTNTRYSLAYHFFTVEKNTFILVCGHLQYKGISTP